ncbi:putative transmembrane protein [Gregarina niphandrodes]|uniref:Transmembrane protein n=1 Tax=Gregarina niphandrodes TaxID=110365 RepID=A0A023AXY2_GRENI|nr:putative transmembrane protein [Gregarina niphandrodes]EZG43499.1 putative transmembrane protein [Gregarina niphandrodes]|eukprot:XP_011133270.1 putative transmembrane protein [Gregarina niphandrodes]
MRSIRCCEFTNAGGPALVAWLMDTAGMQPSTEGCDVRLLTLGNRTSGARVQFLVAARKEAMRKLIEAGNKAMVPIDEGSPLNQDFSWLEECSRIFMCRAEEGQTDPRGEQLAMQELREHLQSVDPDNKFWEIADRISRDSVGHTMKELETLQANGIDNESLEITNCRPLTRLQLDDLRGRVSEEWLPMLEELSGGLEAESGRFRIACAINRRCIAATTTALVVAGVAALGLYFGLNSRNIDSNTRASTLNTTGNIMTDNVTSIMTDNVTSIMTDNVTSIMTPNTTSSDSSLLDLVSQVSANVRNLLGSTTAADVTSTEREVLVSTPFDVSQKTTTRNKSDGAWQTSDAVTIQNTIPHRPSLVDLVSHVTTMTVKRISENTVVDNVTPNMRDFATDIATQMTMELIRESTMGTGANKVVTEVSSMKPLNVSEELDLRKLTELLSVDPTTWQSVKEGVGQYPCGGLSGIVQCNPPSGWYHFGGAWRYDFFAVKEAIRNLLEGGEHCEVACDSTDERSHALWDKTSENLDGIVSRGNWQLADYTWEPSEASEYFKKMLDLRYPVYETCIGSCVDCVNDARVASCHCDFAKLRCTAKAGENPDQEIESIGYNTTLMSLVRFLAPFKTKDLYKVMNCRFECRNLRQDIAALAKKGVDMQIIETAPAKHTSPLRETLSRRELAVLEIGGCEKFLDNTEMGHQLPRVGADPCDGLDGRIACKYITGPKGCLEALPRLRGNKCWTHSHTCYRFGPQWMDVFAVQDAIKKYYKVVGSCYAQCDPPTLTNNRLWNEADAVLQNVPGYNSYHDYYPITLRSKPKFQHAFPSLYPTEKRQVLDCRSNNCTVDDMQVCRVARAACNTTSTHDGTSGVAESIKFNARLQDAFRTLSIPTANAKIKAIKNTQCTAECYGELWPNPDQWPLQNVKDMTEK